MENSSSRQVVECLALYKSNGAGWLALLVTCTSCLGEKMVARPNLTVLSVMMSKMVKYGTYMVPYMPRKLACV